VGAGPGRSGPTRRCVACRTSTSTAGLIRIVWSEGAGGPVMGRTLPGRGAWLHPFPDCLSGLRPGDLARAFRRPVTAGQVAALLATVDASVPPADG